MDLLKQIVSRSYKSRSIKLVIWYFEKFNHPLLIYMLISVIAILLFLLKEQKTVHALVNYLTCSEMVSEYHGGKYNRWYKQWYWCLFPNEQNSYSYHWNLFNEIDVKKLRNYKQLYQISLFFLYSSKCVYLQPRDVQWSISKMVKTVAL